jgi:hypothetical protein
MPSAFLDTISANEWTNVVSTKAMTPVQKKKAMTMQISRSRYNDECVNS